MAHFEGTPRAVIAGLIAGCFTVAAAQAQECQLEVSNSIDATGGSLTYHTDTGYVQALLVSSHAYDDGSTIVVLAPTICDEGNTNRCYGVAVEGFGPGEERSFWSTEILRSGDTVTVLTNGYQDVELTRPLSESSYRDVFNIRRCTD